MVARVLARNSIFVSPISPVILQSKPGSFMKMISDVRGLALTRILDVGPFGVVKSLGIVPTATQPWLPLALTAAGPISTFDMLAGVYDGWTLSNIAELDSVEAIYEDRPLRILQYPSAPLDTTYSVIVQGQPLYFTSTHAVKNIIGADVANASGFDGSGMTATVVDTGGSRAVPQLTRMIRQTAIPGNYFDQIQHGSWCASALGGTFMRDDLFSASTGSQIYCEGMAPKCKLIQVKALDYIVGMGMTSQLLKGIEMAYKANSDVISLSWGGSVSVQQPQDDPFYSAIDKIDKAGVIICAAAGNSGPGAATLDSPGAMPQPVTVGAYNVVSNTTNSQFGDAGEIAAFSSRGPTPWGDTKPDLVAPGAIIDSGVGPFSEMAVSYTHRPHNAQALAGTSMATPIAAGLLLCMRQAHKKLLGQVLTNTEVKNMLSITAAGPKSNTYGWGPITWARYVEYMSLQYGVSI